MKPGPVELPLIVLSISLLLFTLSYSTLQSNEGFQAWYTRSNWQDQPEFVLLITFTGLAILVLLVYMLLQKLFGN